MIRLPVIRANRGLIPVIEHDGFNTYEEARDYAFWYHGCLKDEHEERVIVCVAKNGNEWKVLDILREHYFENKPSGIVMTIGTRKISRDIFG